MLVLFNLCVKCGTSNFEQDYLLWIDAIHCLSGGFFSFGISWPFFFSFSFGFDICFNWMSHFHRRHLMSWKNIQSESPLWKTVKTKFTEKNHMCSISTASKLCCGFENCGKLMKCKKKNYYNKTVAYFKCITHLDERSERTEKKNHLFNLLLWFALAETKWLNSCSVSLIY